MDNIINGIVYGKTILFIDGFDEVLSINTIGWQTRSISEPQSETIVRGPREGFTESINLNLTLIRRRVLSPNLKFEFMRIGTQTKTQICVCYIDGIAKEAIHKKLMKRLNDIDIDSILDSGYIEELIKDAPYSPFRTVINTERPDVVAGKLLEGRFAVVCDGSPVVLTLPTIFAEVFQSNEDYYDNFLYSSFNRFLRWLGFFLGTSVPAIYVAIVTFHQELLPTPLLINIYAARNGVPFPSIVEAMGIQMNKKKIISMIFIIIICPSILCGCWNYREINTLSIIAGMAIDKNMVTNKYILTTEIITTQAQGVSSIISSQIFESEGDSIFSAVRDMIEKTGLRLFWSDAKVVIISESLAKEGIIPAIDWTNRSNFVRPDMWILISKGNTASEILKTKINLNEVTSFHLDDAMNSWKVLSKFTNSMVWSFVDGLSSSGNSQAVTTVENRLNNNTTKRKKQWQNDVLFFSDYIFNDN